MRWPRFWIASDHDRPVIFLAAVALLCLALAASPVAAMQAGDGAAPQGSVLMANWISTAMGDRTRMILRTFGGIFSPGARSMSSQIRAI